MSRVSLLFLMDGRVGFGGARGCDFVCLVRALFGNVNNCLSVGSSIVQLRVNLFFCFCACVFFFKDSKCVLLEHLHLQ